MSYKYAAKPFAVEGDDDEDDIGDVFGSLSSKNKKRKISSVPIKKVMNVPAVEVEPLRIVAANVQSLDSDDEEITVRYDTTSITSKYVEEVPIPSVKNDDQLSQAKNMLDKLRNSKAVASKPIQPIATDKVVQLLNKNSVAIKTASERIAEKESYLKNLLVANEAISFENNSSTPSGMPLKTRLNGKHEYTWRLNPDMKISAWKVQFRELYGVQSSEKLVFRFEGMILLRIFV